MQLPRMIWRLVRRVFWAPVGLGCALLPNRGGVACLPLSMATQATPCRPAVPTPQGHLACAGAWWPFSSGKGNGCQGRTSPSNAWIRVPEQTIVVREADYRPSEDALRTIQAGKALFFSGKALAKADLISRELGNSEILWYWTARRSNPWVIDDLILPDDQYATAGSCYASPEVVLAVSRQARRRGRLIVGAGHSHGFLAVFSSITDLELMSQLAAERVGFASQTQQALAGKVTKLARAPIADEIAGETPAPQSLREPQPVSVFEITFDHNPQAWVTVTARAALSEDDLDVQLDLLQRHQASFFTTHNADGDRYFPIHHVTHCLHCGTRLEDVTSEDVQVHVLGPEELTDEEENDLVAELEEKTPRSSFFSERSAWSRSSTHQAVVVGGQEPANQQSLRHAEESDTTQKAADFFVYRHGQRVGRVAAAVLEEAAYRCPALARALGWQEQQTGVQSEPEPEEPGRPAAVQPAQERSDQTDERLDEPATASRAESAGKDGKPPLAPETAEQRTREPPSPSLEYFADLLTYETDSDGERGRRVIAPATRAATDEPADPGEDHPRRQVEDPRPNPTGDIP